MALTKRQMNRIDDLLWNADDNQLMYFEHECKFLRRTLRLSKKGGEHNKPNTNDTAPFNSGFPPSDDQS